MLLPILLAVQAVAGTPQPSAAPSMAVTPQQFAAALAICRDQIRKPKFDEAALSGVGWPKAISATGTGTVPTISGYRHPENMLLLTLMDFPTAPDICAIMVPFGPSLDRAQIVTAVSALEGNEPKERNGLVTWPSNEAEIELVAMGQAGMRVSFKKKAN